MTCRDAFRRSDLVSSLGDKGCVMGIEFWRELATHCPTSVTERMARSIPGVLNILG